MARPVKWRCIDFIPPTTFFTPMGIPPRPLVEVRLSLEEVEAIRLRDLEGQEQEECAERMHISRPTFHRVLESARRKLADALVNGKAIRIEGGNFEMAVRRFRCNNDGHEWGVPFETMIANRFPACPQCNSPNIQPIYPPGFPLRGWRGYRGGRGRWSSTG